MTSAPNHQAMTPLEARYRHVLRLLPANYRHAWEDDMVATFLETMATDDPEEAEWRAYCARPGRDEIISLIRLAIRLRLSGVAAPTRSYMWGQAVRHALLIGLLATAASAIAGTLQQLWLAQLLPWPPVPSAVLKLAQGVASPSSFDAANQLLPLAAVATFLALVSGQWRTAKWVAGLSLLPVTIAAVARAIQWLTGVAHPDPLAGWVLFLIAWAQFIAMAAFHTEAPRVRRRPWLLALPLASALSVVPLIFAIPPSAVVPLDLVGLWSLALLGATVAYLLVEKRRSPRTAEWFPLTLCILITVVLLLRLTSLSGSTASSLLTWLVALQVTALFAIWVAVLRRSSKALAHVPKAAARDGRV